MPVVYILQSEKNNSYYIGSTNNLERRLYEHNSGMVTYTRKLRPMVLKLSKECETLLDARKLERKIKKLKRKDLIERMIREKKINMGL